MDERGNDNMIYYKNNYGQTVYLDRWPYKMLTDTDLFDYEWSYETQNELNPKISRFYRNMVQKKVGIVIGVKKDEDYATELVEAFEKDVVGVTPGKLYVNDSYVSCYFIKGEKTKWKAGQPFPMVTFTLICEKGSWITESSTTFRPGTTPPDTNSVSGTFLNILDAINSTMYLTSWTRNWLTGMTLANFKTANPSGVWTNTSSTVSTYVISGVTFTVTHSSGNVLSISFIGTSTAQIFFRLADTTLQNGTHTTSGCPSGGSTTTYNIISSLRNSSNIEVSFVSDTGSGASFTYNTAIHSYVRSYIFIANDQTISTSKLFLPQIEYGNVKHNFVPPSGYPVYACQKNRFDGTATVNEYVDGSGNTGSSSATKRNTNIIRLKANTTYKLSFQYSSISATASRYYAFYSMPIANSSYLLSSGSYDPTLKTATITPTVDCCLFVAVPIEAYNIQLEQSSTVTTYEAYNGNTVNLTNDTASPVPMTVYSGLTNVFSGYGGMLNLTYPREIPVYLDYPYDYAFDYMALDQNQNITNSSYAAAHFEMLIYGACTNPSVIIGGHEYEVDCTLATGEYLVINTLNKKVYKVNLDGTKEGQLNNRNRDSYLFEKLPSGSNTVQWNGLFGFDVNMLMERSEPIWI
ncbi:MAG TPA: hypothetical protein VHO72_10660 [Bacteroidales bacterium]|nr:hypothetical protein [Bacteroidales bacterium]